MKEFSIDAEEIAALLDGRLSEEQRADLLARLAQSDDDYETLIQAAAVLAELAAEDTAASVPGPTAPEISPSSAPAGPPPHDDPWEREARPDDAWDRTEDQTAVLPQPLPVPRARLRWSWGVVAAGLVPVVLVAVVVLRLTLSPGPQDPARMVAHLEQPAAGLPAGWTESRPWSTTRGAGDPLTPQARAVRLGATLVDLELALRAQDSAAADLASRVVMLLEDLTASAPAAAYFRMLEQEVRAGAGNAEVSREISSSVAQLTGEEELFELGAWTEAARIAARRRDVGFFRARPSRASINRAAELEGLSEPTLTVVSRIRSNLPDGPQADWGALEGDLAELLRLLGG